MMGAFNKSSSLLKKAMSHKLTNGQLIATEMIAGGGIGAGVGAVGGYFNGKPGNRKQSAIHGAMFGGVLGAMPWRALGGPGAEAIGDSLGLLEFM